MDTPLNTTRTSTETNSQLSFISRVNPTTKQVQWEAHTDDYSFDEEIAASGYGDMVHDTERNIRYQEAIVKAVEKIRLKREEDIAKGLETEPILVLDIGAGTSLLSLMAAEAGADEVVACELFEPMVRVAREVVANSNFSDRIKIVHKRSDEVVIGSGVDDLPARADLLVAELLDTELLGEAVLGSHRDAAKRLLKPNAPQVPCGATVYAQLVESDRLWAGHRLSGLPGLETGGASCRGLPQAWCIQADELANDITPLSEPFKVFGFDFANSPNSDVEDISTLCETKIIKAGTAHGIVWWWDLHMDSEISFNTGPPWVEGGGVQWRNHWMQAANLFSDCTSVSEGQTFTLGAAHDDYMIWFAGMPEVKVLKDADVQTESESVGDDVGDEAVPLPACECGLHMVLHDARMSALNDRKRMDAYDRAIRKISNRKDKLCLSVSDGSTLAFLGLAHNFTNIVAIEDSPASNRAMHTLFAHYFKTAEERKLIRDHIRVVTKPVFELETEKDLKGDKVDTLVGEPFAYTSLLPWQNLYFWYTATHLRKEGQLAQDAVIVPSRATLKAQAVQFKHLWKCHSDIGTKLGFNLSAFDRLTANARAGRVGGVYAYTVSEYGYTPLSEPFDVLGFDFVKNVEGMASSTTFECTFDGDIHGIVLWMDYHLNDDADCIVSESVTSAPYMKQAVFVTRSPPPVQIGSKLVFDAKFNEKEGEMSFDLAMA
eukprot:CFRG0926T1